MGHLNSKTRNCSYKVDRTEKQNETLNDQTAVMELRIDQEDAALLQTVSLSEPGLCVEELTTFINTN